MASRCAAIHCEVRSWRKLAVRWPSSPNGTTSQNYLECRSHRDPMLEFHSDPGTRHSLPDSRVMAFRTDAHTRDRHPTDCRVFSVWPAVVG
ncbi:hypothetical protein R1flu_011699 [Riccia fluitans]|uniref:NHR domain-containing protein n=1 Tax=Riccia fluitans TaxID=41844 RepID=A0ABD1Z8I5_9MARC